MCVYSINECTCTCTIVYNIQLYNHRQSNNNLNNYLRHETAYICNYIIILHTHILASNPTIVATAAPFPFNTTITRSHSSCCTSSCFPQFSFIPLPPSLPLHSSTPPPSLAAIICTKSRHKDQHDVQTLYGCNHTRPVCNETCYFYKRQSSWTNKWFPSIMCWVHVVAHNDLLPAYSRYWSK